MAEVSDTWPEAEAVRLRLLRSAPAWRKAELWAELNVTARALGLSGLRVRYPQASEAELQRRLADLCLGAELAARVYGPLTGEQDDS